MFRLESLKGLNIGVYKGLRFKSPGGELRTASWRFRLGLPTTEAPSDTPAGAPFFGRPPGRVFALGSRYPTHTKQVRQNEAL